MMRALLAFALAPTLITSSHATSIQVDPALVSQADTIAVKALKTLKSQLIEKIKSVGPPQAIEFCSEKALGITHQVKEKYPNALLIKRTSLKIRNLQNAPTPEEKAALEFLANSDPTPMTELDGKKRVLDYYKPIKIEAACLTCHGNAEQIPPGVAKLLKNKYPQDAAKGYKEGDFRGLIHVRLKF